MIIKTHYLFRLVERPWPFILMVNSFNLVISFFFFFKFNMFFFFLLELIFIFVSSYYWWVNYSLEFNLEGKSSLNLEKGVKISIILFISSEVFFFFSFFWSYFHFFFSPVLELGLSWPSVDIQFFDFLRVPIINTFLLLRSGVTITIRHFYINIGKKNFKIWLILTIFLGLLFSIFQLLEYKNSFFCIGDGRFGCSFFILTGFHGIHVLIGAVFLFSTFIRSYYTTNSVQRFLMFELASWYWHFVDVVWIFLYFFLYYLIS